MRSSDPDIVLHDAMLNSQQALLIYILENKPLFSQVIRKKAKSLLKNKKDSPDK